MGRLANSALELTAKLIAAVPFRSLGALGRVLGWFVGRVLGVRRGHVIQCMQHAGVAAPEAVADSMYRGLATGLFELFWLAGAREHRRSEALANVVFEPSARSALDEALGRGPVILGASHTGNWELVAYATARLLAAHGRTLSVVAKPLSVAAIHVFCTRLRERLGLRLLHPVGAMTMARRALGEGSVLVMPIDQVPDHANHAEVAPFLGGRAFVDRAPATLALRARATLLVVGIERCGEVERVSVLATFRADMPELRAGFATRTTKEATRALDAFVRAHPSSFMWLHRRFRRPKGAARRALRHPPGAPPEPGLVAKAHPG